MGRPKTPLTGRGPVLLLAQRLRALREQADKPYDRMSSVYSTATLARADRGDRLPRWPVVAAYAQACDASDDTLAELEELWRRARQDKARSKQRTDRSARFIAPEQITTREELHSCLRYLHLASGGPSVRELSKQGRSHLPRLSRSTAHGLLTGDRAPTLPTLMSFLGRCLPAADGGAYQHYGTPAWEAAWKRVIGQPSTPAPSPLLKPPTTPALAARTAPETALLPSGAAAMPANRTEPGLAHTPRRPRTLARPHLPPGPLKDLKTLLYEAYLAAGAPTLAAITALILEDDELRGAPSRDTVHRCLSSTGTVSQADTEAVAAALATMAAWDRPSLLNRVRHLWVASRLYSAPGQPITECDPHDLEVHRTAPHNSTGPTLTPYVRRPHDEQLRLLVQRASAGHSEVAILVGGTATGKTRACWEAVQLLPPSWRLWHPWQQAEDGNDLIQQLRGLAPHTVIWLNETQRVLMGEEGERIAAALRALLSNPERGPFLVLGTMWPHYASQITSPPAPSEPEHTPHARALLQQAAVIAVPDSFSPDERTAALALGDPHLTAAAALPTDRVLAHLTAAPQLLSRYKTAPPAAQALLRAAADARSLGAARALPEHVLLAAAEGYLDIHTRELLPKNWWQEAINYVTASVVGGLSMLTSRAPAEGEPSYVLADHLAHTLAGENTSPADTLWKALASEPTVIDYTSLYAQARAHGRLEAVLHPTISTDTPAVSQPLIAGARLLHTEGRIDEALKWYERAAQAGQPQALTEAAAMLAAHGRTEPALRWYEKAARAGEPQAILHVAASLAARGRVDEALEWYEQAARETRTPSHEPTE